MAPLNEDIGAAERVSSVEVSHAEAFAAREQGESSPPGWAGSAAAAASSRHLEAPTTYEGPHPEAEESQQAMADSPRSFNSFPSSPKAELQPGDSKPSWTSDSASVAGSTSTGSSGSGSVGSLSPHYDSAHDVILRLEFLRTAEVKGIIRAVRACVVGGLVLLIVILAYKINKPDQHFMRTNTIPVVNLCFAGVLCAALLTCWCTFFYRVYRSNLSRKRWSHRRRRAATLAGTELTLQLTNVVFFIVPNAYVLTHDCAWFHPLVLWSGFVRWTIWNTLFLMFWVQAHSANPMRSQRWRKIIDRPDAAVMDAPLHYHWPKLVLWLLQEGILLSLTVLMQADPNEMVLDPSITDCRQQDWDCSFKPAALVLLCLNVSCLVTYWLLYVYFISRALHNLKFLPYGAMRMANLTVRLQIRLRALSIMFFVLCVICYTFVKLGTCTSYLISWLGYLPMQMVMTAACIANSYISMPKRPHDQGILQVWLQEFAWTEGDLPRKRAERVSSLPPDSSQRLVLEREALFCFETAVKCMFWSFLVYDYAEKRDRPGWTEEAEQQQVEAALALYDLEHFELFWEREKHDTKAVVGWNDDTVVIAFRGTASLNNVKSDLKVWRTAWPAGVGSPLLCSAPQVHQGFLAVYRANDFNGRLLSRLEHILYRCSHRGGAGGQRPVNVYVTGHSLGGALATLCAYDIKQRCPCAADMVTVKCYTFGAPRPGNHAFARLYNQAVPDTWNLINNDDVVTKAGKFWFLYSRCGHRVLLNRLGDLLVRPNYVETAIRGMPGGASVKDHLLTSYQKAVVAVVAAQFGRKSFKTGREGVLSLTQQKGMQHVLQSAGLSQREIRLLQERGWEAWRALQQQQTKKARRSRRRGGSDEAAVAAEAEAEAEAEAAKGVRQLEAVVVLGGPAPGMEGQGAADGSTQPAAAPAADVEAGAPQQTSEERGGVLHMTRMSCRRPCGRRCRTICALLGKQPGAGPAAAAEPASPMGDGPQLQPQQQQQQQAPPQQQLHVIAEEGEAEEAADGKGRAPSPEPAVPPPSPQVLQQQRRSTEQRRGPQHPWWQPLADRLGWAAPPLSPSLSRTLSSASSLGSSDGSSSPTASDGAAVNVRGPEKGPPVFPLVLDWASSGRHTSGGSGGGRAGGRAGL